MVEMIVGAIAALMTIVLALIVLWIVLVIWTLVDMLQSDNEPTWKILWLLVIILLPLLGAILYWLIGKKDNNTKSKKR